MSPARKSNDKRSSNSALIALIHLALHLLLVLKHDFVTSLSLSLGLLVQVLVVNLYKAHRGYYNPHDVEKNLKTHYSDADQTYLFQKRTHFRCSKFRFSIVLLQRFTDYYIVMVLA